MPFVVVDRLGPEPLRRRQPGRPGACPRAHCGTRRRLPALPQAAGLGLPAWPQIALVLDRAARHAPARRNPGTQRKKKRQEWKESSKIAIFDRCPGEPGRVQRTKGKQPLTKPAVSRAARRMPEPVSRQPECQGDAPHRPRAAGRHESRGQRHHRSQRQILDRRLHGRDLRPVARHVGAVADNVVKDLKAAGVPGVRVEGMRQGDWVLIDAGDVIVHVFRPEVRDFYNLEKMWSASQPRTRKRHRTDNSAQRCASSLPPSDA